MVWAMGVSYVLMAIESASDFKESTSCRRSVLFLLTKSVSITSTLFSCSIFLACVIIRLILLAESRGSNPVSPSLLMPTLRLPVFPGCPSHPRQWPPACLTSINVAMHATAGLLIARWIRSSQPPSFRLSTPFGCSYTVSKAWRELDSNQQAAFLVVRALLS